MYWEEVWTPALVTIHAFVTADLLELLLTKIAVNQCVIIVVIVDNLA